MAEEPQVPPPPDLEDILRRAGDYVRRWAELRDHMTREHGYTPGMLARYDYDQLVDRDNKLHDQLN